MVDDEGGGTGYRDVWRLAAAYRLTRSGRAVRFDKIGVGCMGPIVVVAGRVPLSDDEPSSTKSGHGRTVRRNSSRALEGIPGLDHRR